MIGVIKQLTSYELKEGELPDEKHNCAISVIVNIGLETQTQYEIFYLEVITVNWFKNISRPIWGQRSLIVPHFDWQMVRQEINQLLNQCSGNNWEEIANKLGYFLERDRD